MQPIDECAPFTIPFLKARTLAEFEANEAWLEARQEIAGQK